MPYITQIARQQLADGGLIQTAGELNYTFTQAIRKYDCEEGRFSEEGLTQDLNLLIGRYIATHGKSYSVINDILGALEGAKLEYKRRRGLRGYESLKWVFDDVKTEFYRRVVSPYEDEKIKQNGDVY
jgi:hypothetical protein